LALLDGRPRASFPIKNASRASVEQWLASHVWCCQCTSSAARRDIRRVLDFAVKVALVVLPELDMLPVS
jgi:hypothetical protein